MGQRSRSSKENAVAFTFSLNNVHTPQQALYELKELLKVGGWTVEGSGDGTGGNVNTSGDVLTTWSTTTDGVAGAVTNRRAWWRLASPDGQRELLFQHASWNNATDYISIAYSRSAKFVGTGDGALAADVAPTSTDAFLFAGERRPSLSMSGNSFSNGVTIARADYMIGDASEEYSFACFLRTNTGVIRGGMIYDRLLNPADPSDPDPTVVAMIGCYSNFFTTCTDQRAFWTWGDAGVSGSPTITQSNGGPQKHPAVGAPRVDTGQRCAWSGTLCYWNTAVVLNPGGANPYTGDIDLIEPVHWYSSNFTSQQGAIHGESRLIKARSTNAGFNNMDTNAALTRAAQTDGWWIPWDGSTTPLL
jgi:hypothetical protein